MTRIASLSLTRVRLRFREPVRYGASVLATQEIGILRLVTDDGLVGLGEVSGPVLPADLETPAGQLSHAVVGRHPADMSDIDAGMMAGALDTAALDVLGKLQGRSMADLLGGGAASVRVNGLLVVLGTPDSDGARARVLVEAGFGSIKLKPLVGARRAAIDGSLRVIRETVGPEVALRLDLNGDLTEREAVAWLTALGPLDLEYVEQPIAPSLGVAALVRVRAAIPMPLAADESVADLAAAVTLIEAGAAAVLVVKPSRVGGPRASVHIAQAAAVAGVATTISTLYDSGVGLAAALHVAATLPGDRAHGLGTSGLLESDLIGGSLAIVDGRMALPRGAGLGVTLDATTTASELVRT